RNVRSRDINLIIDCCHKIRDERISLTLVFVERREDGAGQYDIFRLSERSYLEHINRAYIKGTSCDTE
ncbi:hypothetical protein KKC97_01745, partial [bacterium]|nr:hypothetical protein [bacterium]